MKMALFHLASQEVDRGEGVTSTEDLAIVAELLSR